MIDEELAWMAGIVDGEGSITIARYQRDDRATPTFKLMVRIGVLASEDLSMFKQRFGGRIDGREPGKGGKRKTHTWLVEAHTARRFLEEILPCLKWKKKQAELGIEFQHKLTYESVGRSWGQKLSVEQIAWRESMYNTIIGMHNE